MDSTGVCYCVFLTIHAALYIRTFEFDWLQLHTNWFKLESHPHMISTLLSEDKEMVSLWPQQHTHSISPQSVMSKLIEWAIQTHACTVQSTNGIGSAQGSLLTLMGTVCEWDICNQTWWYTFVQGWNVWGSWDQWHCIGVGLPALCSINTQHVKPSAGSGNSVLS